VRLWIVLLAGCAHGTTEMITIGPTFGDHSGLVVALELAPTFHEAFPTPSADPRMFDPHHGSNNSLGIMPVASVGADWFPAIHSDGGVTGFVAIGADYLPWLFENGTAVGFGGQVAFGLGASSGVYAVAPRLWFALPVGTLAGAPLTVGLMLRGQLGSSDGTSGAGPSLVLRRADL
jgi:hypothetical protein